MTQSGNQGKKPEGEGSYRGTRGYNEKLKRHARDNDVEKLADEARRALEGPEGAELERADKEARKGPPALSTRKP